MCTPGSFHAAHLWARSKRTDHECAGSQTAQGGIEQALGALGIAQALGALSRSSASHKRSGRSPGGIAQALGALSRSAQEGHTILPQR